MKKLLTLCLLLSIQLFAFAQQPCDLAQPMQPGDTIDIGISYNNIGCAFLDGNVLALNGISSGVNACDIYRIYSINSDFLASSDDMGANSCGNPSNVTFTCNGALCPGADITDSLDGNGQVLLRVELDRDCSSNGNESPQVIVRITVRDQSPPLVASQDTAIDCKEYTEQINAFYDGQINPLFENSNLEAYALGLGRFVISDNCDLADSALIDIDTVSGFTQPPTCNNDTVGTLDFIFRFTDPGGNSAIDTVRVAVLDTSAPIIDYGATLDSVLGIFANSGRDASACIGADGLAGDSLLTLIYACNDPSLSGDTAAFKGGRFLPLVMQDCIASSISVSVDSVSSTAYACAQFNRCGENIDKVIRELRYIYTLTDVCGNADTMVAISLLVIDTLAPVYSDVPLAADSIINTSTALGMDSVCYLADTLRLLTSVYGDGSACAVDLRGNDTLLRVSAEDCQPMITYGWKINTKELCDDLNFRPFSDSMGIGANIVDSIPVLPVGIHCIDYSALDECGNISKYSFTISVEDDDPPTIDTDLCDSTIVVSPLPGLCFATVCLPFDPMITDNCAVDTTYIEVLDPAGGNTITPIIAGNPSCDNVDFTNDWNTGVWIEGETGTGGAGQITHTPTEMRFKQIAANGGVPNRGSSIYREIIAPATGIVGFDVNDSNEGTGPTFFYRLTTPSGNTTTNTAVPNGGGVAVAVNTGDTLRLGMGTNNNNVGDSITVFDFVFLCADPGGTTACADFPGGISTVRYIVRDIKGNTDTCTFFVDVEDMEAPEARCVDTIVSILDINCRAQVDVAQVDAASFDNCGIDSIWLEGNGYAGQSFLVDASGEDTLDFKFIVVDERGNADTCMTTVILRDITPANLLCPPDIVLPAAPGLCERNWTLIPPGIFDNCVGEEEVTYELTGDLIVAETPFDLMNPPDFDFPVGNTQVIYRLYEKDSLVDDCNYEVTIEDKEAPQLVCPVDFTIETTLADTGCGTFLNILDSLTATDNCGVELISVDNNGFFNVGENQVDAFAIDSSGNIDTCTFNVTILDRTPPDATCADVTIDLNAAGKAFLTAGVVDAGTDDNCFLDSFWISETEFDCTQLGDTLLEFIAIDVYGNLDTCIFRLTIQDSISQPQIVYCPADTILYTQDNNCMAFTTLPIPLAGQGCAGIFPMNFSNRSDGRALTDSFSIGVTDVRYTFPRFGGDSLICEFFVEVRDNNAPTIFNCPPPEAMGDGMGRDTIFMNIQDQGACGDMNVTWTEPYALDDCTDSADIIVTANRFPNTPFSSGCTVVSYVFEDESGNKSVCEFVVCLLDTIRPNLQCPPLNNNVFLFALDECGSFELDLVDLGEGTDNCGVQERCIMYDIDGDGTVEMDEMICGPADTSIIFDCNSTALNDTIPIKYWVLDKAGNSSDTCEFFLSIIDNIEPQSCVYDTCIYARSDKDSCYANFTYELQFVSCAEPSDITDIVNVPECTDTSYVGWDCNGDLDTSQYFVYDNDTCNLQFTYSIYQLASCDSVFERPLLLVSDTETAGPNGICFDYNYPVGRNCIVFEWQDGVNQSLDTAYVVVTDTTAPFALSCPVDTVIGTLPDAVECLAAYTWTQPQVADNCGVDSVRLLIDYPEGACLQDGTPLNDTAIVVLADGLSEDMPTMPDLGRFTWRFPKGVSTVSYEVFDYCAGCPFSDLDCDCRERNRDTICSFDVTVFDDTPPMAMDCPGDTCSLDDEGYVYIALDPAIIDDEGCACYAKVLDTVSFFDNCDTLSVRIQVFDLTPLQPGPVSSEGPGGATGLPDIVIDEIVPFSKLDRNPITGKFEVPICDTLPKGDYRYIVEAIDCGDLIDSCVFNVRIYDTIPPDFDSPLCGDTIVDYALWHECSREVRWDFPMEFTDNCKSLDTFFYYAEHEGQRIPISSVDPEGCDSKVDFKGPYAPEFWEARGDVTGGIIHTADQLVIADGIGNNNGTFQCLIMQFDGLVSFHIDRSRAGIYNRPLNNAGYCINGDCEDMNRLEGNFRELDRSFTATVNAGDTLCFWAFNSRATISDFSFTCGGSQHKAIFPVGVSKVNYIISDGMRLDSCGQIGEPNYDTCCIFVEVRDTMLPWLECRPEVHIPLAPNGVGYFDAYDLINNFDDNCKTDSIWTSIDSVTCADQGGITVTVFGSDKSGNIATCQTTVFADPTATPQLAYCPGSTDIYLDENCEAIISYEVPRVAIGCNGEVDMALVSGRDSGDLVDGVINETVRYEYTYNVAGVGSQTLVCEFALRTLDTIDPELVIINQTVNAVPAVGDTLQHGDTIFVMTASGLCTAPADWSVSASDNCTLGNMTMSHASGTSFNTGCTKVSVAQSDASGNTTISIFFVCVDDGEDPLIACKDVTLDLPSGDSCYVLRPIDVLDFLQDDCGIDTILLSQDSICCEAIGVPTDIMVTVFDAAGNSSTCTSTVTLQDTETPTAICQDITVSLGEGFPAFVAPDPLLADNGSYDGQPGNTACLTYRLVPDTFRCEDIGNNDVLFIVLDNGGNADTCELNVSVQDTSGATIVTCPADTIVRNDIDQCCAIVNFEAPTFLDNCEGIQEGLPVDPAFQNGNCFPVGTTVVKYVFTDGSGNASDTCSFSITVIDSSAPSVICPDNQEFSNDSSLCSYMIEGDFLDALVSDNCGVIDTFYHNVGMAPFDTTLDGASIPVGVNRIVWTAVDSAGNVDSCEFIITVVDDEAPIIKDCFPELPDTVVLQTTIGECEQIYTWEPPSDVMDNCDMSGEGLCVQEFLISPVGDTNVTIVAQYEVKKDFYWYRELATDALNEPNQTAQFPVGTSEVTYEFTDSSGNATYCTFYVRVEDMQPPLLQCPSQQVLSSTCPEFKIPDYRGLVNAQDNCAPNVMLRQLSPLAGIDSLGSLFGHNPQVGNSFMVTIEASDGTNLDTCTFEVILSPFGRPIPLVDPLPTLRDSCGMLCVNAPLALDECGDTVLATPGFASSSPAPGVYCYFTGFYSVNWTYIDKNGNSNNQLQQIIVLDDDFSPSLTCNDVTVFLDNAGNAGILAVDVVAALSDGCSDSTNIDLSLSQSAFDCDDGNSVQVTVTATDEEMNTATCLATVTIVDSMPPDASCNDVTITLDANGEAQLSVDSINAGSDNCGVVSEVLSKTDFDCDDLGPNIVQLILTDAMGNADTCESNVTVQDTITPTAICNDVTLFLPEFGSIMLSGADVDGGSTDNCPITLSVDPPVLGCANTDSVNIIVLTATDAAGNSSTCEAMVTVRDTFAPTITALNVENDTVCCSDVIRSIFVGENCRPVTVSFDAQFADGTDSMGIIDLGFNSLLELALSYPPGLNTLTFSVTDKNGQTATYTYTINVLDNQAPIAICRGLVSLTVGSTGDVALPAEFFNQGSFDQAPGECSGGVLTDFKVGYKDEPLGDSLFIDCSRVGTTPFMLQVSDCAGNTGVCWGDIRIDDKTPPVCVANDITVNALQACRDTLFAIDLGAGSTDNCSPDSLTYTVNGQPFILVDVDDAPEVIYTLIVTDASGNTAECTGTITVLTDDLVCPQEVVEVYIDTFGVAALDQAFIESILGINFGSCVLDTAFFEVDSLGCTNKDTSSFELTIINVEGTVTTCDVLVQAVDTIAPFCEGIEFQEIILGANGIAGVELLDIGFVRENCTIIDTIFSPSQFDCSMVGKDSTSVTLILTDDSGNVDSCEFFIEVIDNIAPSFVCDEDHFVVLNNLGQGSLSVIDIVETLPDDNCEPINLFDGYITVSRQNGTIDSGFVVFFDCSELGSQSVVTHILDEAGNENTCTTTVVVVATDPSLDIIPVIETMDESEVGQNDGKAEVTQVMDGDGLDISDEVTYLWSGPNGFVSDSSAIDSLPPGAYCVLITNPTSGCATLECVEVLEGAPPPTVMIAGLINNYIQMPVECIEVNLSGNAQDTMFTAENGRYAFEVMSSEDYTVRPRNDMNPRDGLSTMDLVKIQLHVLGISPLEDPYKIIAADVNNDGEVSTGDLIFLQALLLGIIDKIPFCESWQFVDADYVFPDPTNPWSAPYPEEISFMNIIADELDADFIAIKMGDVTDDMIINACEDTSNLSPFSNESLQLVITDQQVKRGEIIELHIQADNFEDIRGYQWALDYDTTALQLMDEVPESELDHMNADNFARHRTGRLLTSWYNGLPVSLTEEQSVLTLRFKVMQNAASLRGFIRLGDARALRNEAYGLDDTRKVSLRFTGENEDLFALMQNTPNPFRDQTSIGFTLPAATAATLTCTDVAGRTVLVIEDDFDAGYNEVFINRDELPAAGVIYYTLKTKTHSASRKMILID